MAVTVNITWKFPEKDFFFLKIEKYFVAILAILVFILSFANFDRSWLLSILFTLIFFGLYVLSSYLIQRWRKVEEKYKLTKTHLEVIRKRGKKTKKEKVALKDIIHHNLDKFFLGGYLLTNKKIKHLLFFNNRKEAEMFEKFISRVLKKKK